MKKYFALTLMVMAVLVCTVSAQASGLFGSIISEAKQYEPTPLPSFSVFSHLPYEEKTTEEKMITYSYGNISSEQFEEFGVYLENLGYSVWNSEIVESMCIVELGKDGSNSSALISAEAYDDEMSFVIKYGMDTNQLEMVYPVDSKIEEFTFINEISYASKAEKTYTDSVKDHFGNTYKYSLSVNEGAISIPVNGKYSRFSGIIAYPGEREYDSYRESASFVINADGKQVYESPVIDIGTYPVSFDVDVNNCKVIEIVWSSQGKNMNKNWGYDATIYNGMLY